ncbi:hypothetical protein L6452_30853 [Arctium lappa]|uniref:Uncharacterized protein n=1 Tax=Arctium lappa TaxID=4217 RepID=A0ACB8ZJT1_ARCLA|nr:hypothetical protein L6452_30853 [Arctium lappa]
MANLIFAAIIHHHLLFRLRSKLPIDCETYSHRETVTRLLLRSPYPCCETHDRILTHLHGSPTLTVTLPLLRPSPHYPHSSLNLDFGYGFELEELRNTVVDFRTRSFTGEEGAAGTQVGR